jgi:autophagy-related protein 18
MHVLRGLPFAFVRVVVVLSNKLHIFDLESMRALAAVDCADNPRGLCLLSPNDKSSLLVFPSSTASGACGGCV